MTPSTSQFRPGETKRPTDTVIALDRLRSTDVPRGVHLKRRSLPVAAAFAATTALLLTACGGGGDSPKDNDKIAGADQGETGSASPGASA